MGSDLIQFDDFNHIRFAFFGEYNPENVLITFEHEDEVYFYRAKIKSKDVPLSELKNGLISPLEFDITSHEIKQGLNTESFDRELKSRIEYGDISAMVVDLKLPNRTLDYKLNLCVVTYVLISIEEAYDLVLGPKPILN